MIDAGTADAFRYIYAFLAMLACAGFTMTLILRWDVLHVGERLLRMGLVAEHAVIVYGAYLAISGNFPPSFVGIAITVSLLVVMLGFVVWFGDLLLSRHQAPERLTDR